MILTTTRHGRTSRDVRNLKTHLAKQVGQVARVAKIGNCPVGNADDAYRYMEAMRDGSQATVAMHHITISPRQALTEAQLDQAVSRVLFAMGAEDHAYVLHHHAEKARAGAAVEDHYHLVLGHVGPDCRALDDRDSYGRLEAAARSLEVDFGEELTHSRRTRQVAAHLHEMGRGDVAAQLIEPTEKPRSAMSSGRRAAAERAGIDLPKAKVAVAEAWASADSPAAFRSALREKGFDVAPGAKAGVFVVMHEGTEIGALDRLVREKRAVVAARMQEVPSVRPKARAEAALDEILAAGEAFGAGAAEGPGRVGSRDPRQDHEGRPDRPSDPSRGEGPPAAPVAPGSAGGRRDARSLGADHGAPRPDPDRHQQPAGGDRGSREPDRGAARRAEVRQAVLARAAVVRIGKADLSGLLDRGRELALSPADRARRDLAERRDQAQARLDKATEPVPDPPGLARARAVAAAASAESGKGFEKTTAAEKAVAVIERQEPRGFLAFFRKPAWRRAVAEARAKHEAEKGVWLDAAGERRDAQRALDRETQLAARARLSAEAKAKPVADEARDELATIKRAEALLKEQPGLARAGIDAVMAEARRQLLEEAERRRLEEERRQHRPIVWEPEPEPAPAGPRFG